MATKLEYIEAKKEYGPVKYFPFNCLPADPFILTADPWNYLNAWLESEIKKLKGKRNQHHARTGLSKALYFAKLAQNFEFSAKTLSLPIKALPVYYSALNLVKTYLLVKGIDLETKMETHGVTLRTSEKDKLHINGASKGSSINLFLEFAKQMNVNCIPGSEVKLLDIISELPEIHEMAFNLKKVSTAKRRFLPIEIKILTDSKKMKRLIYEIIVDKKHSNRLDYSKLEKGVFAAHLSKISEDANSGEIVYRSKEFFAYTHKSDLSWKRAYSKICKQIQELNVATMLTRSGHRYYLNLQPSHLSQQTNYFLLLYYMGSAARYRPTLFEEYLQGEYQAIFNEALSTSPDQFLYSMVSHITNKVCAVPMAKLD